LRSNSPQSVGSSRRGAPIARRACEPAGSLLRKNGEMQPSWITANNPGPFTLSGTRTFLVGERRLVVIDPGPADDEAHLQALAARMEQADEATILLTHGHADHAGGLEALVERTGARARGVGHELATILADGEVVDTDHGALVAVETPGHANPHIVFHWPDARAAFVGDLVLGWGDTTWVGEYPGCVADYLQSLDRLSALACDVLFPAHGEVIDDVAKCLARYRAHRLQRIEQVRDVLRSEPEADLDRVFDVVYGEAVLGGYRRAAEMSVDALLDYVRTNRG
jgi:glyoxylase-like metal-dependent hydrolase (beta-lactamase superfamily II)